MGTNRYSANARNRGPSYGLYLLTGLILLIANAAAAAQMVATTGTETQPSAMEIPENLTREEVRDLVHEYFELLATHRLRDAFANVHDMHDEAAVG